MESILSVGLQGVQTGVNNARNAAQDIVNATTVTNEVLSGSGVTGDDANGSVAGDVTNDLTTAMVELKVSEHQVKAATAVIKTADEMMGTLIDIKA